MTYTVKYRKFKSLFWTTLRNVKGDGIVEGGNHRYFLLNNETRIEIPYQGTEFKMCGKRFWLIKQKMEQEAGTVLPIKQ